MNQSYNYNDCIELAGGIYWVGHFLPNDQFQCHVYLIKNGDNSVLIDPGSKITFHHVLRKIEKILPFTSIRYFICQHQDPDITSSLQVIDQIVSRPDAVVLSHWRAIELLKHYDLKIRFECVEKMGWELDIGGRKLEFIFSPYLHFPGAYTTYDPETGTLFSSDIFGGFTEGFQLFASDESYMESMRPFHEHYMPAKEILQHYLSKLDNYDISMIAPQHGSIIRKELIPYFTNQLKNLDCGIFILTQTSTEVKRLSNLNSILQSFLKNIVLRKKFGDIAEDLLRMVQSIIPITGLSFYAVNENNKTLFLSRENLFHGVETKIPEELEKYIGVTRVEWEGAAGCLFTITDEGEFENGIILPLFTSEGEVIHAVALFSLSKKIELDSESIDILQQMSIPLGVAVEREIILRTLDMERQKFYDQAIRDPLTNLYTRIYMNEAVPRLMHIHDRDRDASLSVIMLDVDHFKSVNDNYGHNAGDMVLKRVSATILETSRAGDIPVRFGGEEFLVFMVTHRHQDSVVLAERIRSRVEKLAWSSPMEDRTITVSLGVVNRKQDENLNELLYRADTCLYKAKESGRNRVVSEG